MFLQKPTFICRKNLKRRSLTYHVAQSLDFSIAYMFVGSIIISSFFFINWGFDVVEFCPTNGVGDCSSVSYSVIGWLADLGVIERSPAEAVVVTGWFAALFQVILVYAFYSGMNDLIDTEESFLGKNLPIGVIISLILSVLGQFWWLTEVQKLGDKTTEVKPVFGYYLLLTMTIIAIYFAYLGWQDKKLMAENVDNLIVFDDGSHR
jgi:hypothetical protein